MFINPLQYIEEFQNIAKEIMGLDSLVHFDMIRLDCEDLKRGLAEKSRSYADMLLGKVAADHREENERWGLLSVMCLFKCLTFHYDIIASLYEVEPELMWAWPV